MSKVRSIRLRYLVMALTLAFVIGVPAVPHFYGGQASAVESVGDPNSPDRILYAPEGGKVARIVYVSGGTKTMAGANTPVASDKICAQGAHTLYGAEIALSGTMTGTAPTVAFKWQHSFDNGTTWHDVGSWTTVNATVTPAVQNQMVSDIYNATTAVAYGDCWRATYTFGGSGTVTANFSITGFNK